MSSDPFSVRIVQTSNGVSRTVTLDQVTKRAAEMVRDHKIKHCSCHFNPDLCGPHNITSRSVAGRLPQAVLYTALAWNVPEDYAHDWAEVVS